VLWRHLSSKRESVSDGGGVSVVLFFIACAVIIDPTRNRKPQCSYFVFFLIPGTTTRTAQQPRPGRQEKRFPAQQRPERQRIQARVTLKTIPGTTDSRPEN
jgi:hypothetical protein